MRMEQTRPRVENMSDPGESVAISAVHAGRLGLDGHPDRQLDRSLRALGAPSRASEAHRVSADSDDYSGGGFCLLLWLRICTALHG